MKKTYSLLLIILFHTLVGKAQNAAQYCFSAFGGAYVDITGGTSVSTIQFDDQYTTGLPIGFSFNFCGVNYTTVSVSSNGWLSFNGAPGGNFLDNGLNNVASASLANIAPALMPLWDDVGGQSGLAFYQTSGAAPNRVFTMEWRNWNWNYASGTPVISFQVKLFETTNVIQFVYRQESGPVNNNSNGATIGIAKTTTDYQTLPNTLANPLPSKSTFYTNLSAKPATGQIYQWTPPPPCSGQPMSGMPTLVTGCPTYIYLAGSTCGLNISYQWQSRINCNGAGWTNISGATNPTLTIASQSQPTDYRAIVVCTTSGGNDTSVSINVANVAPCYCTSAAAYTGSYHNITNVSLGALTNNSPCSGATYTDYSSLPAVNLLKGELYSLAVSGQSCGSTNYSYGVAVFIDFNRDGTYSNAERVFGSPSTYSGNINVSGNVTIPTTAQTGITGMRVIMAYNTAGSSITGCWNNTGNLYYYGETEDYLVNLVYAPTVTGTGLVNGDVTFCSGANATLTATAPGVTNPKFLWKKPNGTWDTAATLTLNNLQPTQAGTYTAYILYDNCPGSKPDTSFPRMVTITVNPTPGKPIVAPVVTYCQGAPADSVQIYGENIQWYTVPTGGVAGPYPNINTAQPSTATFYVSQIVDGCEGPRAPVTISVAPKPPVPTASTPVGYCQGVPAAPLVAQGQNLRWYSIASGGVGTPIAPTPSTNAQGTFTWYVTQTIAGCESNRQPVVVNVSYLPNGLITATREFVCQYDTISIGYFGNALPTADYIWTLPEGASVVSGSGQGPLVVRFDSAGTQPVKLVVDNNGCIGSDIIYNMPVHLSPRLTIDVPDDICQDEAANLVITYATMGIDSFEWNFDGAEVLYGSVPRGPFGLKWNTSGQKTVSVIATDNTCKSLPASDMIEVKPLPDATITASKSSICAGDSVQFSVAAEPGASYQWLPHQLFGESTTNNTWGIVDHARSITVNATSMYNCKSTGEIWVNAQPCCQVYFPTAFTPNNDGNNDYFHMLTVSKDKNAQTQAHQIAIFRVANRWGQTVFETTDETKGWDGNYNGKPQDMGTYYFYVKYRCADGNFYEEKGEVTLVR